MRSSDVLEVERCTASSKSSSRNIENALKAEVALLVVAEETASTICEYPVSQ